MMDTRKNAKQMVAVLGLLFAVLAMPRIAPAEDIRMEGTYVLSSNGDVAMTLKLSPPMVIYQQLRDSVSNLYLVLRQFSSARADTEVVDKKADWDDSNRSMSFSMKLLGAARNLGNRWELDIPKGTEFINIDEGKRIFYFNESVQGGGATVRGTSKLIMPPESQQLKYEGSRRVVTYTLPPVKTPTDRNLMLLIAAGVLGVLGAALTAASFFVKSKAAPKAA
jgi:hypothetical protein